MGREHYISLHQYMATDYDLANVKTMFASFYNKFQILMRCFFSCRVNIRETGYEEAEIAIPVSEHNLKNKQNKLPNKDAKTSWVNNLKGKTLACFDTQEKKNKNPSKNI